MKLELIKVTTHKRIPFPSNFVSLTSVSQSFMFTKL